MMNKDGTKVLLLENYISTNSRKIAWHVTKIDEDMRNFPKLSTNALMTKIPCVQNKRKKLLEQDQVQWCSNYRVCLTRRKSSVWSWTISGNQFLWKRKIRIVQKFCSLETIFQITPGKLPDTWRKSIKTCKIFPKLSTNAQRTKIPGLQNKKKKLLKKAQVLWCSGYHVCLTRRRSPVRSWRASEGQLS